MRNLLLLLLSFLFNITLLANSFFVRYNPSQIGSGTSANPWGRLEYIDWSIIPDSSSIHLDGIFKKTNSSDTLLYLPASFGSHKKIVFKSWYNNAAIFDGDSTTTAKFGVVIRRADSISFEGITFRNFFRNHIFVQGYSSTACSLIVIRKCTFEPLKVTGVQIKEDNFAAIFIKYCVDSRIDTCSINQSYSSAVSAQTDGIYSQGNVYNSYVGNNIILHNSINSTDYHIDGIQSYQDGGLNINKNTIYNGSSTFGTHQNRQGIYATDSRSINIINNNVALEDGSNGISVSTLNCFMYINIFHNTVVNRQNSEQQLYLQMPYSGNCASSQRIRVYNNIFYKEGDADTNNLVAVKLVDVDTLLLEFDNNIYYNHSDLFNSMRYEKWSGNTRTVFYDYDLWKDVGRDGKGGVGDPNFTPETNYNYELSSSSNLCIDQGYDNLGIAEDRYSVYRPQLFGFDIGAFEYLGMPKRNTPVSIVSAFYIQNFPNPFNPNTNIRYFLPQESQVILSIYNILGQKITVIVSEKQRAGEYQKNFDASSLPSGVYIASIKATSVEDKQTYFKTQKMIYLK